MYHLPQMHQSHKNTGAALKYYQTSLYSNEKEGFKQNREQLIVKANVKLASLGTV